MDQMLESSIQHWLALADEQDRAVAEGIACCPQASRARADTFRRTARALQLEQETGKPHCVCCLKER